MMKPPVPVLATVLMTLALAIPSVAAETSTVTGKLVDVATYVTHDHNMDSMRAMKGSSLSGDHAMAGDHAMSACPPLGIVTDSGRVYLVATQMDLSMGASLCKSMNSMVTLLGKLYAQGGTTVFLVTALK